MPSSDFFRRNDTEGRTERAACRRPLATSAVLSILMLLCTAPRADAGLILVEFSGGLPSFSDPSIFGPLNGLLFSGSFTYEDPIGPCFTPANPSCQPVTVPLQTFSMSIGGHQFDLSHGEPGAFIYVGDGGNAWGPIWALRSEFMFGALTSLTFAPQGSLVMAWSFSTPLGVIGRVFDCLAGGPTGSCSVSLSTLPPEGVPEPSSLIVGLGAAAAAIGFRRRSRRVH